MPLAMSVIPVDQLSDEENDEQTASDNDSLVSAEHVSGDPDAPSSSDDEPAPPPVGRQKMTARIRTAPWGS